MKKVLFVLLLACAFHPDVRAALPPGISGTWYNPAQSGHGVNLQLLDDGRALGFWFVYDPQGNPVHLYLDGRVADRAIVAEAWHSSGMRFGTFNPSEHRMQRWGDVEIDFSDCSRARLSWAPGGAFAGWGAGGTVLLRLAGIAGLSCALETLPHGTYSGHWDRPGGGDGERPYPLFAAVDRDGRLWAAAGWSAGPSFVRSHGPAPMFVSPLPPTLGAAAPLLEVRYASFLAGGVQSVPGRFTVELPLSIHHGDDGAVVAEASTSEMSNTGLIGKVRFDKPASGVDPLLRDYSLAQLAGRRFSGQTIGQFFDTTVTVRFGSDGSACVDSLQPCQYAGRVLGFERGMSMFSFELQRPGLPGGSLVGKGWVDESQQQLVLVGSAGEVGLGFVAHESGTR